MQSRDQVIEIFKNFTESQFKKKIKYLKTDQAAVFLSKDFESFLTYNGIEHRLTAPYCHYQNGVVEQMNRTLV